MIRVYEKRKLCSCYRLINTRKSLFLEKRQSFRLSRLIYKTHEFASGTLSNGSFFSLFFFRDDIYV